jgi:hypothetical protein
MVEKIFSGTETIVFVTQKIFSIIEKILFGAEKIFSGPRNIAGAADNMEYATEKILPGTARVPGT